MAKSILGSFGSVETKKRELSRSDVELIYYKDIKVADRNRKIRNVEELAEDILEDGLEHNILVRELENNSTYKYEIIAGHRRFSAIGILIKKGHSEFEYIPCKVKRHMDDVDARRRLHLNNINQSGYTPSEMLDAIEELEEIYRLKKKQDGIPGRIQKLIADDINLSKSQVGNYQYIINNATPELRELIRKLELPLNVALEISTLDHENQLMFIENEDCIDLVTIKEYKEELYSKPKKLENFQDDEEVDYGSEDDEIVLTNYTEFDAEEDYDQYYEDDNQYYDDSEDTDLEEEQPTTKKLTLQEMSANASNSIKDMLATMEKYSEWKKEREELEEIYNQFKEFVSDIGL